MAESSAKFLTGNLFRHVAVMSLTASVGLMAIFIVDFVDLIFISMLGKTELAAAVGYAGAILFFTTSFGIGLSIARAIATDHGVKLRVESEVGKGSMFVIELPVKKENHS